MLTNLALQPSNKNAFEQICMIYLGSSYDKSWSDEIVW